MTQNVELTLLGKHYEDSNKDRLDLIDDMDWLYDNSAEMHPRMFTRYTEELAHRAVELAKRDEVYPMQAYGLATRLAALNPALAETAQSILTDKFADKPDMPKPLTDETLEIVNKTVERSIETEDDTITLPRIAIAASMDYMEHQIDEHAPGTLMQELADKNEHDYQNSPGTIIDSPALGNQVAIPAEPNQDESYTSIRPAVGM